MFSFMLVFSYLVVFGVPDCIHLARSTVMLYLATAVPYVQRTFHPTKQQGKWSPKEDNLGHQ